jgi:hypothetical protein
MDAQKFAVDLIAWNLWNATRWLGEGLVGPADHYVGEARHYLRSLPQETEAGQRARILIDWTGDLVANVSHRLAPAGREALAKEYALLLGGAK